MTMWIGHGHRRLLSCPGARRYSALVLRPGHWRAPQTKTPPSAARSGIFGVAPVGHRGSLKSSLRRDADVVVGGLAQHIAAAPHGFDEVLATRCVGEFLAQLADEYVDDFELRLVHAAVEMVEEHLLRQSSALAQREEFQHLVLLAGEVDTLGMDLNRLGVEID